MDREGPKMGLRSLEVIKIVKKWMEMVKKGINAPQPDASIKKIVMHVIHHDYGPKS